MEFGKQSRCQLLYMENLIAKIGLFSINITGQFAVGIFDGRLSFHFFYSSEMGLHNVLKTTFTTPVSRISAQKTIQKATVNHGAKATICNGAVGLRTNFSGNF